MCRGYAVIGVEKGGIRRRCAADWCYIVVCYRMRAKYSGVQETRMHVGNDELLQLHMGIVQVDAYLRLKRITQTRIRPLSSEICT
ncbi:unnamed protein product [Victoria cruziana]